MASRNPPPHNPPHGVAVKVSSARLVPALLATGFALHHTYCVAQRRSPFPAPFRSVLCSALLCAAGALLVCVQSFFFCDKRLQ